MEEFLLNIFSYCFASDSVKIGSIIELKVHSEHIQQFDEMFMKTEFYTFCNGFNWDFLINLCDCKTILQKGAKSLLTIQLKLFF